MTFTPPRAQLCGLSLEVADLYGKPHIGAHYERNSATSHKRNEDTFNCFLCGRRVESVHHVPPLSKGHQFILNAPDDVYMLKPALFAICGTGTTGCHNGFHGGARFVPRWKWNSERHAQAWWDGTILKHIKPHSYLLYAFGHWVIHDKHTGKDIEVFR